MSFRHIALVSAACCHYLHVWPTWVPAPVGIACCWLPVVPVWIEWLFPNWFWWEVRSAALTAFFYTLLGGLVLATAVEDHSPPLLIFGLMVFVLAFTIPYAVATRCGASPRPLIRRVLLASIAALYGAMGFFWNWSLPDAGVAIGAATIPLCAGFLTGALWTGYYAAAYSVAMAGLFAYEGVVSSDMSWLGLSALNLFGAYKFLHGWLAEPPAELEEAVEDFNEPDDIDE